MKRKQRRFRHKKTKAITISDRYHVFNNNEYELVDELGNILPWTLEEQTDEEAYMSGREEQTGGYMHVPIQEDNINKTENTDFGNSNSNDDISRSGSYSNDSFGGGGGDW